MSPDDNDCDVISNDNSVLDAFYQMMTVISGGSSGHHLSVRYCSDSPCLMRGYAVRSDPFEGVLIPFGDDGDVPRGPHILAASCSTESGARWA